MKRTERIIQVVILLMFIYYSQFYKLSSLPYRIWDEARLATSAYEMSTTGNLIVPTIDNKPDLWNTKPPLMIWAQELCIKVNNLNELSVRFPAAICGALTIILILWFTFYLTRSSWAALVAATVLCTARGYIGYHGTRYGDYDSMLAFFITVSLISFFLYTEETDSRKKTRFLLLFFFSLSLASLTKGVAALLFAPAILIYIIARKQLVETLANKYLYVGIAIFLSLVLGYYLLREHYNPGFLKAVYENELGGRFLKGAEGHNQPANYYFHALKSERFKDWFWMLPVGLILLMTYANRQKLRATLYAFLCAGSFLTILSMSQTKLPWYDMPAYPLFAIIIGLTVHQLAHLISTLIPAIQKTVVVIVFCILVSASPVYEMFNFIKYEADDLNADNFYAISYYLRNAVVTDKDLNKAIYLYTGYDPRGKLYVNRLKDKGIELIPAYLGLHEKFHSGQRVMAYQDETKTYIESNFEFIPVEVFYNVTLYQITGNKVTSP